MHRKDTEGSKSTTTSGFHSRFTSPLGEPAFSGTPDTDLASPTQQTFYPSGKRSSSTMAQGLFPKSAFSDNSNPSAGKRVMDLTDRLPAKKRKLTASSGSSNPPRGSLPLDMWVMVMQFLSPFDLGILLQVNRSFHDCLVSGKTARRSSSRLSKTIHNPETIWTASRELHCPDIPGPPPRFSEIEIWKLLFSKRCQSCTTPSGGQTELLAQGLSYPGSTESDIIWSFGIRSCRACLKDQTVEVGFSC